MILKVTNGTFTSFYEVDEFFVHNAFGQSATDKEGNRVEVNSSVHYCERGEPSRHLCDLPKGSVLYVMNDKGKTIDTIYGYSLEPDA